MMRAYVRYYLKYTPDVLDKMSDRQLMEAYMDVAFVRSRRPKTEPED
ncbi:MAG: hypothetical protein IKO34_10400 [Bacteroidales bacterium]|nr:hypothetical protein [Bacteroidales bacterium]